MNAHVTAAEAFRPPWSRARIPPFLWIASAAVCALVIAPTAYLLLRATGADAQSWELVLRPATLWLALRSISLVVAVTGAAVVIGVPLAWLTARSDLPGRRAWAVLLGLPLVIPSYVGAFALLSALGPRGILQGWLEAGFGIQRLPDISGFPGAFLALTLFTYPYVYLLVAAALRGLDPALEESARSLGSSRASAFRRVTLPLLRPSLGAGALLVALYTLHDFGAVSLMRFSVFTQAIYLQYKGAFDRTPAAILSLMLVAIALVIVVLERRARGRARYFRTGSGSQRPVRSVALGRWKLPALLFCAAVVAAALVLPLSVVVFWLVRGIATGREAAFAWGAAAGSVLVSALGAALALVAAWPIALVLVRFPGRLAAVAERTTYAGYALPGLVVALAFVFFAANLAPWGYQTLGLVVVAYVVLFLPQAVEPLRTSLLQVGPRLEEAARALGNKRSQAFRRVVAPLAARGAVAGAMLVFLTSMKELPATLLLRPTGFETLATRVWTGASVGLYSKAAAPALMLVVLCCLPLYLLARRVDVREVEVKAE